MDTGSDQAQAPAQDDKAVIDHVADEVTAIPDNEPTTQSPVTPSGKPVEEQVRKEWDSNKDGGLPTFIRRQTGEPGCDADQNSSQPAQSKIGAPGSI
jgi:hypothetical protein